MKSRNIKSLNLKYLYKARKQNYLQFYSKKNKTAFVYNVQRAVLHMQEAAAHPC
jgi:hypothetical protein